MRRLQRYVIPAGQRGIDNVTTLREGTVFLWAEPIGSAVVLWLTVPVDEKAEARPYVFRVLDRPGLVVGDDWKFLAGVTIGGQPAIVFQLPGISKESETPGVDPFKAPTKPRRE